LGGDIEASCRFVEDNEIRVAGECDGDAHPLLLPAGKLVGVALD
jgi:hypothetical protein